MLTVSTGSGRDAGQDRDEESSELGGRHLPRRHRKFRLRLGSDASCVAIDGYVTRRVREDHLAAERRRSAERLAHTQSLSLRGGSVERRFLMAEIQIGAVEVARLRQILPISDGDVASAAAFDQLFGFEGLQRAVYMHRSQARAISQLLLRHRKFVFACLAQSRQLQAERELAEKMRQSRMRISPPDVRDPLPEMEGSTRVSSDMANPMRGRSKASCLTVPRDECDVPSVRTSYVPKVHQSRPYVLNILSVRHLQRILGALRALSLGLAK